MTYKGGIFSSQDEHQGFWAFAAWHGHFEESSNPEHTEHYLDMWSCMPEQQRSRWRTVAKVVRWDTRTEPIL